MNSKLNHISEKILFLALLFFGFIVSYHRIQTGDIWWSMAEGRYIFENGYLPQANIFSYTNPDAPWSTPQWLFSLSAFLIYQLGGIPLFIILRIILVETIVLTLFKTFQNEFKTVLLSVIGIVWVLFAINFRLLFRAHLFSVVFFTLTVYFVSRPVKKTSYIILFFIFLIWSNIHAGVLFGLFLILFVSVENIAKNFLFKHMTFYESILKSKSLLILFSVCFLGALVNPHLIQFITYPYSHLNVNDLILISEYMPPSYFGFDKMLYYWLTIPIFFLSLVFYGVKKKQLPPFLLSALFFLFLSIKYNRIIPYFEIVAIGIILKTPTQGILQRWHNFRFQWILHLVAIYALVIGPLNLISGDNRIMPTYNFGIGIDPTELPVHAVRFLNQHPAPDPYFNDFFWGGYLIWNSYPEKKVFIDGRIPAYPSDFIHLYEGMSWNKQIFEAVDSLYNFQTLVIINPYSFHWMDTSPLDRNNWALVFWNSYQHSVYVKRNEQNRAYIKEFEYKLYDKPYTPAGLAPLIRTKEDTLLAIQEIKRHNYWAPDPIDRYLLKLLDNPQASDD